MEREKFKYDARTSFGLDWRRGFNYADSIDYADELKSVAPYFGFDEDDIETLLNDGYTFEEIEEAFYGYCR